MALRAGYKGFKKLISPLILNRPGTIGIDGDALNVELNKTFYPRSEETITGVKNMFSILLSDLKSLNTSGTWSDNVYTHNSVTFTVTTNSAGYVTSITTANTATGGIATLHLKSNLSGLSGKGLLILNGCPSGGSASKYEMSIVNSDGTSYSHSSTDSSRTRDFGTGTEFDVDKIVSSNSTPKNLNNSKIDILIRQNQSAAGLTFYPMISYEGGSFVPYVMTNSILTTEVVNLTGGMTEHKEVINAIISAATGAADFAAFKAAMGNITPLTRGLELISGVMIEEPISGPDTNTRTTKKSNSKKSTATAEAEKEGE